jgi:predicted acyl esterase
VLLILDFHCILGYAALGQDVRGTVKSGGKFNLYMSEGDDYRTCGDWVVAQGKIYRRNG